MLWVTARIWTRLSSQTQFSPGGVTAASKMFTLSGSARQEVLTCIFSQNKQFCTWTDWWLTDCVSWPVSKRRCPVVLPGHSALTVPHQVPQAAFSSQVHIAAFARLALSNWVFAPVFCKPWRWPVSIFPHLVKIDNHQSEKRLRMLTIGTGGPLGTGAGSLGKGGAVGSQPAPSCSPTWWSRSRSVWNIWERKIGRLANIARPENVEIITNLRDWSWLSLAPRLEPVASLPGFPGIEESTWKPAWCQVQDYPESIFTCLLLVPPQAWSWLLLGFHRIFSCLWSVTEPKAERHLEKRLWPLRIWLEESLPEGPPSCLTLSASNYWCLAQTGECNPAMALQPRRLMGGWNAWWSPSHLKASDSRPPDKHQLDSSPPLSKLNSLDHLCSLVLGYNFPPVLSFARHRWLWYKPHWSALT